MRLCLLSQSPIRATAAGGDMLKLDLNLKGIEKGLDKITVAAQGAVRPAAQAGAQIFYERVKEEAPVSKTAHMFHIEGRVYGPFSPGDLRDSIYQVFSKREFYHGETKAAYEISFNHGKAPYGFMVLRGTSRAAANDFIGRAYDATYKAATQAASDRLTAEIKKAL